MAFVVTGIIIEEYQLETECENLSNVKLEDYNWTKESCEVFIKKEEPLDEPKWDMNRVQNQPKEATCSKPKTNKRKKKYKCDFCQNERFFIARSDLDRHVNRIHLKLKPFECDICKISFAERGCLKSHIKAVHIGERNHACNYCEKKFVEKNTLLVHINSVHLKLKPFECDQCKKRFISAYNLNLHVRLVHLNEKPFACKQCSSKFKSRIKLNQHISTVHELNVI